jgi:hypothetical protein
MIADQNAPSIFSSARRLRTRVGERTARRGATGAPSTQHLAEG